MNEDPVLAAQEDMYAEGLKDLWQDMSAFAAVLVKQGEPDEIVRRRADSF